MEQETFWTLLRNLPHWEFELFLIFIFDVLLGVIIWPQVKKFTKHHKTDDERIHDLEEEIAQIKEKIQL